MLLYTSWGIIRRSVAASRVGQPQDDDEKSDEHAMGPATGIAGGRRVRIGGQEDHAKEDASHQQMGRERKIRGLNASASEQVKADRHADWKGC